MTFYCPSLREVDPNTFSIGYSTVFDGKSDEEKMSELLKSAHGSIGQGQVEFWFARSLPDKRARTVTVRRSLHEQGVTGPIRMTDLTTSLSR